jgi:uncharacterized protein
VVRFSARVHPRANRNAIRVLSVSAVEIWTTAPPADGKANAAISRLIADWLAVAPSDVAIVSGAGSRTKVIDVSRIDVLPIDPSR